MAMTVWAAYWRTRWGTQGITLHQTEAEAWLQLGELIDLSDITEAEAEAFWQLRETDLDAFRSQFYDWLEATGHEVLIEEVALPSADDERDPARGLPA